jgi:hypothetical protein
MSAGLIVPKLIIDAFARDQCLHSAPWRNLDRGDEQIKEVACPGFEPA